MSSRVSSTVLSKQKRGQVNTFLEDESNRRTLPLSVDILMGEAPGLHSKSPLQDRTFYTALMLGFTMLTRASNYLPIASATYHLNTEHIAFTVAPAPGTIGAPVEITADNIGEIPLSRIIGASAFLTRLKVDNTGKGKRIPFLRQTVNPPVCVYDIVTVLYQYVLEARPVRGKPFFYVPSLHWSLTPVLYNQRLRGVAIKHGLDPDRVHSHSVCIGGATLLAAAGVRDYVIMAMGGWASAVYLQYIRPSLQIYAAAQAALANTTFLSASSIRAVHSHQMPGPTYDRDRNQKASDDAFKPSVHFAGILDL
jgi:hypothetical protein